MLDEIRYIYNQSFRYFNGKFVTLKFLIQTFNYETVCFVNCLFCTLTQALLYTTTYRGRPPTQELPRQRTLVRPGALW